MVLQRESSRLLNSSNPEPQFGYLESVFVYTFSNLRKFNWLCIIFQELD